MEVPSLCFMSNPLVLLTADSFLQISHLILFLIDVRWVGNIGIAALGTCVFLKHGVGVSEYILAVDRSELGNSLKNEGPIFLY